jgi:hypothetical protein
MAKEEMESRLLPSNVKAPYSGACTLALPFSLCELGHQQYIEEIYSVVCRWLWDAAEVKMTSSRRKDKKQVRKVVTVRRKGGAPDYR